MIEWNKNKYIYIIINILFLRGDHPPPTQYLRRVQVLKGALCSFGKEISVNSLDKLTVSILLTE